jgi:uncharacterized metal-binding protein YceD (DUF177 family)
MTDPKPEFSRPIRADAVHARESVEALEANAGERAALARRLDLQSIGRLAATVKLRRVRGGTMIRIAGELEADVVQTCVATLAPVPARVAERFDALFAPPELIGKEDEDDESVFYDPTALEEEDPEPIADGRIDIGELVAQHLSLALDPYPRADGAVFDPIEEHPMPEESAGDSEEEQEDEPRPSPFAALEKLRRPE